MNLQCILALHSLIHTQKIKYSLLNLMCYFFLSAQNGSLVVMTKI